MDPKIVLSVLCFAVLGCFIEESLQSEPSFSQKTQLKFASKTRYQRRNFTYEAPRNCEPLHISMVLRHGTRYPSRNDVEKIDKMLKVVNEVIDPSTQKHIGDLRFPWKNPFSRTHDKLLTSVGEEEMYNIAKELLKRFPSLLLRPYRPQNFDFISTGTSRATQSAMAFAFGLYEGRGGLGPSRFQPVSVQSREVNNDPLLRFFDLCPKYLTEVAENKTALLEYKKFKHGEQMRNVLQKVSSKLIINPSVISEDIIVGMYTACIFEVAIYDRANTWCQLFDDEDLMLSFVGKHSQLPENATDPSIEEKKYGTFMFAHGETLQPLYALLGLFMDREDLKADNFLKQLERKYRTSYIAPFGANIAFVVYKCTARDGASNKESECYGTKTFIVQVFVNEELIALPCCGKETECPLETFLQCFDSKPNMSCNLSSLCSVGSSGTEKSRVEL
ncbi:hypothetical protein OS493_029071 [Desmophyllum pertusum]|uniref:Multiple inositol polyphosphate phosphatase 1 n=1 Tax=Desmophyllum pertusum TaxID=174260 RepID=A0A9W9YKA9_9CNID|nr:hypothetical protein OS493_029071 [Desmophyllum pertusum]